MENEHKLFLLHSYGGSENYKYKKLDKKITLGSHSIKKMIKS